MRRDYSVFRQEIEMVKTEYFSDAYAEIPRTAMSEGQVSLRVENLACVRGLRVVFADLNFALAGGGVLHVSGANGAGKTSLLRMICGLLGTRCRHYFACRRRGIFAGRRRGTGRSVPLSGSCRWPEKHTHTARNDFL
jgi:ABC-type molybdenum transport system ATPase subunit/photorepair protein PhrA